MPPQAFLQKPTIAELAEHIYNETEQNGLPACLIPIRSGSIQKKPLFLVHAIGGDVMYYHDLVSYLDNDYAIYGIQARTLEDKTIHYYSIEDIIYPYINAISAVQKEGPYYLIGSSLGGMLVYEMAQQFYTQGKEVALLAMLDTRMFGNAKIVRKYW